MATYSTNLALTLLTTGEGAGTWGNTTNTNLGTLLEQAISGYVTQGVSTGTDTTLTIPNGATGVARNMYIELTGTGGASTNLVVPANKKLYFIFNNTTGAVTVKASGQTGVSVAAGNKVILVCDGTDIVEATSYLSSIPTSLTLTTLTATSANITTLTGTSMNVTTATHASANITQLQSTSATITTLTSTSANITTLTGTSMNVTTATHASANITQLQSTSATITTLTSTSAGITTLTGTSATITNILDGSGLVRNIPQNSQTTTYTLQASDNGKHISTTSGAVTVPNNTFAAGNVVSVYNNSASSISLNISTTTAYVTGTNTNRTGVTLSTRGICTVLFINPSYCIVSGNVT
jgi:hypothetical protein